MHAQDADIQVWLATPDAAERLDLTRLGADDAARWQEIRTERRRRDWASSRTLLEAAPRGAQFSRSLSHSRGFAALALASPSLSVGVDIEAVTARDFLRMAEVAFSEDEAVHLASVDLAARPMTFYRYWTLKEAFAKALALPLADALTQCRFVDASGDERPSIPTSKPWRATVFAPRPDLCLAVACVAGSVEPLQHPIHTLEWPQPMASPWPIVLDLLFADGTCASMPEPAPCAGDDSSGQQANSWERHGAHDGGAGRELSGSGTPRRTER